MTRSNASARELLLRLWRRLAPLPGGRWLFSRWLGWMIPYTGSVRALILDLEPGHARLRVTDRRKVRNHLGSVHAIAIANAGELATGLALNVGLSRHTRGIVTRISVDYLKKARGRLTVRCACVVPSASTSIDHDVRADVFDAAGDCVAIVTARWRLGPVPRAEGEAT